MRGVAAPVFGPDGKLTAGISVGCLAFELTEDDLPAVIQAVQAAAKRVTDRLAEIGG